MENKKRQAFLRNYRHSSIRGFIGRVKKHVLYNRWTRMMNRCYNSDAFRDADAAEKVRLEAMANSP